MELCQASSAFQRALQLLVRPVEPVESELVEVLVQGIELPVLVQLVPVLD